MSYEGGGRRGAESYDRKKALSSFRLSLPMCRRSCLLTGEGRGEGVREEPSSYDVGKAWSSVNDSILSGLKYGGPRKEYLTCNYFSTHAMTQRVLKIRYWISCSLFLPHYHYYLFAPYKFGVKEKLDQNLWELASHKENIYTFSTLEQKLCWTKLRKRGGRRGRGQHVEYLQ